MLLEGSGFALVIATYLYLMSLAPAWPPDSAPPDLFAGTAITLVLLASLVPNHLIAKWARAGDLKKVRIGIVVMSAAGILPLVIRIFEFPALNVSWDDNAYGSILWILLGLHTTHLLTDVVETLVIAAVVFTRHGQNRRRLGDVEDNALYWAFVVLTWLPLYACIYGSGSMTPAIKAGLRASAGLVAGPAAWAVNTQGSQLLPHAECAGAPGLSLAVGLLAIALALAGAWISFSPVRRHLGTKAKSPAAARSAFPQSYAFVALVGGFTSLLVAFALSLQVAAAILVPPCLR
jgi:heme/copper-type cytochrome/quinol oxidase subunit 3